tara:strand:- start:658 stop:780 length:123 start_codon:yes stop_codon:yes gene_type:complete
MIPFASIKKAKTDDRYDEVKWRLENLRYFYLFNGTFNMEC